MKTRHVILTAFVFGWAAIFTVNVVAHDFPSKHVQNSTTRAEFVSGEVIVKSRPDVALSNSASKTVKANGGSLDATLASIGARQADQVSGAFKSW